MLSDGKLVSQRCSVAFAFGVCTFFDLASFLGDLFSVFAARFLNF